MKKQFSALAIMLVLSLCLTTLTGCGDTGGLKYRLNDDKTSYTCTGYREISDPVLVIPSSHEDKPVTAIASAERRGRKVFSECDDITGLVVPESVSQIGEYAFQKCENLEWAVIEGPLTVLEWDVFNGCVMLRSIQLPSTLTQLSQWALSGCDDLTDIVFLGTSAQWEAIDKQLFWVSAPRFTVHCIDAELYCVYQDPVGYNDGVSIEDVGPADPSWQPGGANAVGGDRAYTADAVTPEAGTAPDDSQVYDGEDDSEDGLPPAVPNFTGTEIADIVSPYRALAVEYNGYIYYLDEDSSLCRADTNMQGYELFCESPLGDDSEGAHICGITNAGMLYIGSPRGSCYLDTNNASLWNMTASTFSGEADPVNVYGISGEWMYYTRAKDISGYLYRCKLGGGGAFYTEETVLSLPVSDVMLDNDTLVYTLAGEPMTIYAAPIGSPESAVQIGGGSSSQGTVRLIGLGGGRVIYSTLSRYASPVEGMTVCVYDMDSGSTASGSGKPTYARAYDAERGQLLYFENKLMCEHLDEIDQSHAYYNGDGYVSPEFIASFNYATIVGNWYFFKDDPQAGGAEYFTDTNGVTLTSLD